MRTFGFWLICLSAAAGVLAAASAYLVSLSLPDEQLEGLTLAAPAGTQAALEDSEDPPAGDDLSQREPLYEVGTKVDAAMLQALRDQSVENLRVKEFAWERWRGKWWFILAAVGMLVGARLGKSRSPTSAGRVQAVSGYDPRPDVESLENTVRELLAKTEGSAESIASLKQYLLDRLHELQSGELARLADARGELIERMGLSAYAQLTESLAPAERHINRAWSTAADGALEESRASLQQALSELAATRERLASLG